MKDYPTMIVKNFLSNEDIAYIEEIFQDADRDLQIERAGVYMSQNDTDNTVSDVRSHYVYPGETRKQVLHDFINSKIHKIFDKNIRCVDWHILNAFLPYPTHSDSFDDLDPIATGLPPGADYAFTFLIPLDNYNTNTIVFNEESTYTKNPGRWIQENNIPKKNEISDNFYDQYLGHHDINGKPVFDHLSVEFLFPWTKGDLLTMSRHSFHCSDNFPAKGLKVKRALIGWSHIYK